MTGKSFILIYKKARNLSMTGLLETSERLELEGEGIDIEEYIELQAALSFASTWGSLILVYTGLETPVYIARLPPTHYFYLGIGCDEKSGRMELSDDGLLRFWAYLSLGRIDRAFESLGSTCIRLDRPRNSCLSYIVNPLCSTNVRVKPSPAGIMEESLLPAYLRSSSL